MQCRRHVVLPAAGVAFIRLGTGAVTAVDADDYKALSRYRWKLKKSKSCSYVARVFRRKGKNYVIKLHRQVMSTPPGQETHHINHDPLDNRKRNLVNLSPAAHRNAHHKTR